MKKEIKKTKDTIIFWSSVGLITSIVIIKILLDKKKSKQEKVDYLYNKGYELDMKDLHLEALCYYRTVLSLDPNYSVAKYAIGRIYFLLNDLRGLNKIKKELKQEAPELAKMLSKISK